MGTARNERSGRRPGGSGSGSGITRVLSDDRLAQRAAKGDKRAFAAIFDRYHQSLYRYCLAIVGNSQDAQDALQNTMIKVLRALPGEERQIELKPWLYRIAHNESIELLRRRRETRPLDPELAAPGSRPGGGGGDEGAAAGADLRPRRAARAPARRPGHARAGRPRLRRDRDRARHLRRGRPPDPLRGAAEPAADG